MKVFVIIALICTTFFISSFAQEEYKGTQKFLRGVAPEYDEKNMGFDIEYVLEGELQNLVIINDENNSITFEYDSKGVSEDVLIIYLPQKIIEEPLAVYVNGDKEPNSIHTVIGNMTQVIIPLYEDSKTITIQGTKVASKISEENENLLEKGMESAKEVIEKGKGVGQSVIESETERRQEIDQKRLETKEAVEQKGSEVIQEIEEVAGGGCLIATATYGSELAPQVQQLREIRDKTLLSTKVGTSFMKEFNAFYYSFSPLIADYERENPLFREAVKLTITPMISSLSILSYVDMDSELAVLGYGISLIFMNVGMYVVAPAAIIREIKKKI